MYYLLLIILYPLALLPMRVLYLFADLLYFLAYYVTGYRKNLVLENLRFAFPEKPVAELLTIRKQFYKSFADQWIETLKLLTITEDELDKRMTGNWEVFDELYRDGKNTYALLGHTFNWEWANVACQYHCRQQFVGVYMPVDNPAFDKLIKKVRTRSGAQLISMKAKKAFSRLKDMHYIVGLIADQNPSNLKSATWHSFMNRPAPFFNGPEQLAKRNRAAVVFAEIKKLRRGYYHVTLHKYADDASILPEVKLMNDYVAFMEKQISEQPANWMWTHNRWKHTLPKEQ